jgi:multiple sugar transport system permease protein
VLAVRVETQPKVEVERTEQVLMGAKEISLATTRKRQTQRKGIPLIGRTFMIWGAMGSAIVFFSVWTILPVAYTFFRSFYDWQPILKQHDFIGLGNYQEALLEDTLFWKALYNTLYFSLANVGIGTFLCLIVAMMINATKHFSTFFRISYFMPVVTSLVAVSLVWQFIFQPRFGILNSAIFAMAQALHLPPPREIGWLTRPEWAMISIILMSLWKYLGFRMVIFLAGLQAIPDTFYEAAQLDGAGRWAQFRYVTIPLLAPTLVFVLVIGVINSLQTFAPMYIMTQGGPMNATVTVVLLLYQKTFELFRFGYGAAISFLLFGLILALTVVQLKLLQPRWQY